MKIKPYTFPAPEELMKKAQTYSELQNQNIDKILIFALDQYVKHYEQNKPTKETCINEKKV